MPCTVSSTSAAYVSGIRHPLSIGPGGGACTHFRTATGSQVISYLAPFQRRPIPWTFGVHLAPDWVEDGITAASARRSRASSITSTRLQQLTQDWHVPSVVT